MQCEPEAAHGRCDVTEQVTERLRGSLMHTPVRGSVTLTKGPFRDGLGDISENEAWPPGWEWGGEHFYIVPPFLGRQLRCASLLWAPKAILLAAPHCQAPQDPESAGAWAQGMSRGRMAGIRALPLSGL